MIPSGREFYLACARERSRDRKWIMTCLRNYDRVLRKEWAAAATATQERLIKN